MELSAVDPTCPPDGPPGEVFDSDLVDALAPVVPREVAIDSLGFVRLVDAMPRLIQKGGLGPEAAVVQAARICYGAGTKTVQSDEALLRYLFRHRHMTPFEMITLKFCARVPLFTARQWMRHRTGSFNETSARYGVIPADYYEPDPQDVCEQSPANKQGSGKALLAETAEDFRLNVKNTYAAAEGAYNAALSAGVAREMARIVLPEGRYTSFYWTVNLRNLFAFLELRMDAHAQDNIRAYANGIYTLLLKYCPLATKAFDDYTRLSLTLTVLEVDALKTSQYPKEMSARERTEWDAKRAKFGL